MNLENELAIAVAAVREASELCQRVQLQLSDTALKKKDRSPVTVADYGSQALICSRLRAAFPADPIIAEENADALRDEENGGIRRRMAAEVQYFRGDATEGDILDWVDLGGEKEYSDRFWTLDPIDGTKGFLRGDQYAVALALIENGRVVLAAVGCPNLKLDQLDGDAGVVMSARAGEGTIIQRISDMAIMGMASVSDDSNPSSVRLCESVEAMHTSHSGAGRVASILGITADPVRLDSQAKYAVVASGNAEIYLRLPSDRRYVENIWDHAGGSLLVEEAGGVVTDIRGNHLDFSCGYQLTQNRGVIVSNGKLHDRLLTAIEEAGID